MHHPGVRRWSDSLQAGPPIWGKSLQPRTADGRRASSKTSEAHCFPGDGIEVAEPALEVSKL